MSNQSANWLSKLDEIVDRAFVGGEEAESHDERPGLSQGRGLSNQLSDVSDNSRHHLTCSPRQLKVGISKLRTTLHIPARSPPVGRHEDRQNSLAENGNFDSFVAEEAPRSGELSANSESPMVSPLLPESSMLEQLPEPPLFSERSHQASEISSESELANSESGTDEQPPILPSMMLPQFESTGQVTHENPATDPASLQLADETGRNPVASELLGRQSPLTGISSIRPPQFDSTGEVTHENATPVLGLLRPQVESITGSAIVAPRPPATVPTTPRSHDEQREIQRTMQPPTPIRLSPRESSADFDESGTGPAILPPYSPATAPASPRPRDVEREIQSIVQPPTPVGLSPKANSSDVDDEDDSDRSSNDETLDWSERDIEISATHSSVEDADFADFDVKFPLTSWDEREDEPFDPSMNCHGIVHVRVLRAQRLPCSVGSNIYAIVALPPWKGRIRTERTKAFLGPENSGVCVRWDQLSEAGCCSMVHQWNSEETPIPTITVDLMLSPLQMLEFKVCSLELPCRPLMRLPGSWKKIWLQADAHQALVESSDVPLFDDTIPLVELEAAFVPATFEDESSMPVDSALGGSTDSPSHGGKPCIETNSPVPDWPVKPAHVSKSSASLVSSQFTLRNPTKAHLFRVQSYWTPASCSVCSSTLTGWKRGYQCEVCKIDCCRDCQLQVDLQIPCSSAVARAAVENSIQNKMTLSNFLSMVAPMNPSSAEVKVVDDLPTISAKEDTSKPDYSAEPSFLQATSGEEGIGSLRINIIRACIFDKPLPPEHDPSDVFGEEDSRSLRQGDYYVRISWTGSKESTRTRTVQKSGKPRFDAEEMNINVPHYGMEYRVEVLDANSDKPVGTTVFPTQGLLQWQRDLMVEEKGVASYPFLKQWKGRLPKRRTMLELRTGVKSGFGADFFVSSKAKEPSAKSSDKTRAGEISGWLEIELCLEEDMERLYGPKPVECPPRPPDDLNVDMFQIHIARIAALVDDIKKAVESYVYLISWKDPALTSLSLIVFVPVCLRFNTEYVGSLPVFFLIVYMLHLAAVRSRGNLKERFIRKEKDARIEVEKKITVKYSLHRPIGRAEVGVHRGVNIRSRDLGLTGSVGCRIYWDPLRYQDESIKDVTGAYDKSVERSHDIGFTSYKYAKNPVWDGINNSDVSRRLNQLLPGEGSFFEDKTQVSSSKSEFPSVQFPLLQPIVVRKKSNIREGEQAPTGDVQLGSWNASPGAVVVEVRFHDVLNKLPGFDDVLGEVSVPMSVLVKRGDIRGWFRVLEVGSKMIIPGDARDEENHSGDAGTSESNKKADAGEGENELEAASENPQIYVHLRWEPPAKDEVVTETDREASIVVAEEMIRSAILSQEAKIDLIGSSIGALNTVRGLGGNVQFIQNTLGMILDTIEQVRNAFNFTDPLKSSILLLILMVLLFFLALVPTRALVLVGGLAQYVATFVAAYFPPSAPEAKDSKSNAPPLDGKESKAPPFVVWLLNAFRALPTDEDLRKTYFWESRRVGERESEKLASKKRASRLHSLWKADWHASVELKMISTKAGSTSVIEGRNWDWQTVFAIVQSRRFLWWHDMHDFDSGEAPLGRIFLAGHAGLAGLSPLDLRELREDEIPLVVSIFGRGIEGQQKITLLLPDPTVKDELESTVIAASTKSD